MACLTPENVSHEAQKRQPRLCKALGQFMAFHEYLITRAVQKLVLHPGACRLRSWGWHR